MPTCGSGLSPPPPPAIPGEESEDWVLIGVLLCEGAVILIALGANVQRYALAVMDPDKRGCLGIRKATLTWLAGLTLYFLGNCLFITALGLAPASLLAALLATVVVANAVIARLLLGERLQRCDYHGGCLIVAGIAVTAMYAPYEEVPYDAVAVTALFADAYGALYTAFLLFVIVTLALLVMHHERTAEARKALREQAYIDGVQVPRTRPIPACTPQGGDSPRGTPQQGSAPRGEGFEPGLAQMGGSSGGGARWRLELSKAGGGSGGRGVELVSNVTLSPRIGARDGALEMTTDSSSSSSNGSSSEAPSSSSKGAHGDAGAMHVALTVLPATVVQPTGAASPPPSPLPSPPPSHCAASPPPSPPLAFPPFSPPSHSAAAGGHSLPCCPSLCEARTIVAGSSKVSVGAVPGRSTERGGDRGAAEGGTPPRPPRLPRLPSASLQLQTHRSPPCATEVAAAAGGTGSAGAVAGACITHEGFGTPPGAYSGGGRGGTPADNSCLTQLMPFAYPIILGCLETLVQARSSRLPSTAFHDTIH